MLCQYAKLIFGDKIHYTDPALKCNTCATTQEVEQILTIYRGHTIIDNIMMDALEFIDIVICPKCNATIRFCFGLCHDDMLPELLNSTATRGEKGAQWTHP